MTTNDIWITKTINPKQKFCVPHLTCLCLLLLITSLIGKLTPISNDKFLLRFHKTQRKLQSHEVRDNTFMKTELK